MSKHNDRILMEAVHKKLQQHTRRQFLRESMLGLGAIGFAGLYGCGSSSGGQANVFDPTHPLEAKAPQFAPKARSVIYLHMAGAPSQLETFDFKPDLQKLDGQDCPPSLLEGKKFAFIRGVPKMLGPQVHFAQYGESRAWISDHLPFHQKIADDLCFLKAVTTDQFNHAPAQLLMHTGSARLGRPSMGSWVTYGLGTENENLPAFVVLVSGGSNPDAGKSIWGSGFLPSVYQGVQCRSKGDPVLFLENPEGIDRDIRKMSIEAINEVNAQEYKEFNDPEILSRIFQYEMAFKMQVSVPEAMDISDEPEYIHQMYGTEPGKESFANNALLARKLVEKGVRFVQLFDWGWDAHGTSQNTSVVEGMEIKCGQTDRAVAALIADLKQRGLLDETLVVWGGEFGRTPMAENRDGVENKFKGRDHHVEAFTMYMAGGGIKRGFSYGETDEIGYAAVSGKVNPHDIQATILNQLGFDHEQFTFPFQGRPFRLTDVEGKVINEIIA
ncbi:DUF1501 domain-containing protein [Marinilongibacter aquaticus]|uniref:DUF1501 domain-containing protein n=1 Tax=Marinilongibacter aquaticus TaxID=2975157 RepID=UPI0021BD608C|nr:DUF1501 domain-containing protein [Marinilongibacter aquaticus]UBM58031.1 DUF1501 domain-containing protein [Marinilongibacter aquaticus]